MITAAYCSSVHGPVRSAYPRPLVHACDGGMDGGPSPWCPRPQSQLVRANDETTERTSTRNRSSRECGEDSTTMPTRLTRKLRCDRRSTEDSGIAGEGGTQGQIRENEAARKQQRGISEQKRRRCAGASRVSSGGRGGQQHRTGARAQEGGMRDQAAETTDLVASSRHIPKTRTNNEHSNE